MHTHNLLDAKKWFIHNYFQNPTQNILGLQGIGGGFVFLVLKCELGFLHLLPLTWYQVLVRASHS